jgi:hypothetical protein
MSHPRIFRLVAGCLLLVAVFAICAVIASHACSVIGEEVSNEVDAECVTVNGVDDVVLKSQWEHVIFGYPVYLAYGTTSGEGSVALI